MKNNKFLELSDIQLLSLMREGNQLAFHQIYNRYWEILFSSTINILKDKGQAEDVIHEVFLQIWSKRETSKIRNLKSYLFKAVRNNALLKIRNKKFIEINEELIRQLSFPPIIEQKIAQNDLKYKIEKAAKFLPSRCREIFFMSRYQEYSIREIAEYFNISHRTVENQLHIALKHLRNTLGNMILLIILLFLN